jgi:hypothetical protein
VTGGRTLALADALATHFDLPILLFDNGAKGDGGVSGTSFATG